MHQPERSRRRAVFSKTGIVVILVVAGVVGGLLLAGPLLFQAQPLTGDNFSSPIVISGSSFSPAPLVITTATTEFADPDPGCGANSRLRTVWYQYTAPANAKVTIVVDTSGSNYDTILSVYTGGPGSSAGCNDDATGNITTSKLVQHIDSGQTPATIYFMVSQADANATPQLKLNATVYGIPTNDLVGTPKEVNSQLFTDTDADYEATAAGEPMPMCGENPPAKTVWYRYTPSAAGTVTANTAGSTYDTVLNVYSGTNSPTTFVICNDDAAGGGVTSQVSFTATTGTNYWLMVSAYDGDIGTLTFHFEGAKRRGGQITSQ